MKKSMCAAVLPLFAAALFSLAGCRGPFNEPEGPDTVSAAEGKGRVIIGMVQPKTLLPQTPVFSSYLLTFEYSGAGVSEGDRIVTSFPCTVELVPGEWTITVTAYTRIEGVTGIPDGDYPAAEGETTVSVLPGTSMPVTVNLHSGIGAGQGVLRYDIGLPMEGLHSAELRILTMDGTQLVSKNLAESPSGSMGLDAGYYLVRLTVYTGRKRSKTELLHIYDGLTTEVSGAPYNFGLEDGIYLSTAELSEYLSAVPTNTAETPYPVKLNVNMTSLASGGYALGLLFSALNESGRYVDLDLSDSVGDIPPSSSYSPPGADRLAALTLPSALTSIGNYAFRGCASLASVEFPDSLQSIGNYAFYGCISLAPVDFPDALTSIGDYTFSQCTSLEEITFPASLTSINNYAFSNCASLSLIDLSSCTALESLGNAAFRNCSMLEEVRLPTGLKTIDGSAFHGSSILEDIIFPASLETIGSSAFYDCTALGLGGPVSLPASVKTIGAGAFQNCTNLDLTVPANSVLENIGVNAFRNCSDMGTGGRLSLPVTVKTIGAGAFQNCANLDLAIPTGSVLESIGANAFKDSAYYSTTMNFSDLEFLVNIDLSGYTDLESLDLSNCVSLPSINLTGCTALESVDLSGCMQLTGINASGLTNLETVDLGDAMSLRGSGINFSGCASLSGLTLPPTIGTVPANAFSGCTLLIGLAFAGGQSAASMNLSALTWLTQADLSGCVSLTSLGNNTFKDCAALQSVILPAGIENIGASAFQGCTALAVLNLPAGLKAIDAAAFSGCAILDSLDFSVCTALTSIGENAFKNCTALQIVTLPAGVKSIGASAFQGCTGLTSFTFPAALENLDASAFAACTSLGAADLSLCASLKNIEGTFTGCTSLASALLPTGLETIGANTFKNCALLVSANLPAGLKTIGASAFENCTILALAVNLQGSTALTGIGDKAFFACNALTAINLSGCTALTSIGNNAFSSSSAGLTTVNVSGCTALTTIGNKAFYCNYLTTVNFSGCSSLVSFGDEQFYSRYYLTQVNLSDCSSLESLGAKTFFYAQNITSLGAGSGYSVNVAGCVSLKTIGSECFYMSKIASVDFSALPALTDIGDHAFESCNALTSPADFSGNALLKSIGLSAFTSAPLSSTADFSGSPLLKSIGGSAFSFCAITAIDFSGSTSLISIGDGAFFSCTSLASVDFSDCTSLQSIGYKAFYNTAMSSVDLSPCVSLTAIDLVPNGGPTGPQIIVSGSFYSGALVSLVLPSSLGSIGVGHSFQGPTRIKSFASDLLSLTIRAVSPPGLGSEALEDVSASLVIYVPQGSVDTYKAASGWSAHASKIQAIP